MTLQHFFKDYPRIALAFSGGCDSAYLLYTALQAGCDVHAYYVKSAFQPAFELEDAKRLATQLGAKLTVIDLDVLRHPLIVSNPSNRCYYCKGKIFDALLTTAKSDGYEYVMDGTNASDDFFDRPGMLALLERNILSPLRECGITKDEVRRLSKEAGLFTWNKPAYACLATRIASGEEITLQKLQATEYCEAALSQMGFSDFRIRLVSGAAKIQLPESQLEKLLTHRTEILEKLKPFYTSITLDLEVRS
jgi:uncharacterized protein